MQNNGALASKCIALILTFYINLSHAVDPPYSSTAEKAEAYSLPALPYGFGDLEPWIDRGTVQAHYEGHHENYRRKMNALLDQWRDQEPLNNFVTEPIIQILRRLDKVPDTFSEKLRNNLGGFINHCFYWSVISPNHGTTVRTPGGALSDEITTTFGSFESFKSAFSTAALELFGSGYVWLVRDRTEPVGHQLSIATTINQDCPLSRGLEPLLVIDIWEHAYYLKHQYRRTQYISDWWMVVDWTNVEALDKFWIKQSEPPAHDEF